jgi:hypothetical protein
MPRCSKKPSSSAASRASDELPRDLLEAQRVALLLAELADQVAVTRVHAHRRLQPHVAQGFDVRQIGGQVQVGAGQQPDPPSAPSTARRKSQRRNVKTPPGWCARDRGERGVEIGKRLFITVYAVFFCDAGNYMLFLCFPLRYGLSCGRLILKYKNIKQG